LTSLAAGAALGLALPAPAFAATIQLTILAQPYVGRHGLDVHLDIRNNGDAAAHNLLPFVALRGEDAPGTLVPVLEPRRSLLQTIRIPLTAPEKMRGVWPLFVRLSYGDANNHPFEAVHVVGVPFGPEAPAPLPLRLAGTRLETTGELNADIEAPAGTSAALTFVVPAGLAVAPEQTVVTLTGARRRVTALLTNAGATAASVLPAFVVAEYDVGDRHGTSIATAMVEIASAEEPAPPRPAGARIAALALLFAALGLAARWRHLRSRAR
jgi:hypothetical protein